MQQHSNHRNTRRREKEKEIEAMFEKIMTENFQNVDKEKNHTSSGSTEDPNQVKPKEAYSKIHHN